MPTSTGPASRRSRRWLAAALVGALLAGAGSAGCARDDGAPAQPAGDLALGTADLAGYAPPPTEAVRPDRDGLQEVLDQLAAAFRAGDAEAVAVHLHDPETPFGRRWQNRARWMQGIPIAHYALVLDPTLGDLGNAALRDELPGAQVAYVAEELAIEGFDAPDAPARDDLFLTVVPTDDGWKVVGDEDAEPLGFVSVDHLWDLGPVTVTRNGDVAVIHRPAFDGVAQLLAEAQRARDIAASRWPLAFPDAVPILVPDSEEELAELLHVTFDLSNFVAFATATPYSELTRYDLTGSRIVVNPDRFLNRDTATRELILVHEFIHVATHEVGGYHVPNWLDEGVAQAIGERRSATGTRLLDQLVQGGFTGLVPTDTEFRIGGSERVFLSYQQAWSFVDFLVRTYGVEAVAAFYAEVGRGSVDQPGSEEHRVDVAAREVFGVAAADLQAAWAADLAG